MDSADGDVAAALAAAQPLLADLNLLGLHPEWATQCMAYVRESAAHLPVGQLAPLFLEQVLFSDLADMAVHPSPSSLPPGIAAAHNAVLAPAQDGRPAAGTPQHRARPGVPSSAPAPAHLAAGSLGFFLQVVDIAEVGVASNQLLDAIRERKPKRGEPPPAGELVLQRKMLRLTLSDGMQTCSAMEYAPIPDLTLTSERGIKVFVSNVLIRRGVLLLTPENTRLLGGSVAEWNQHVPLDRVEQQMMRKLNAEGTRTARRNRTGTFDGFAEDMDDDMDDFQDFPPGVLQRMQSPASQMVTPPKRMRLEHGGMVGSESGPTPTRTQATSHALSAATLQQPTESTPLRQTHEQYSMQDPSGHEAATLVADDFDEDFDEISILNPKATIQDVVQVRAHIKSWDKLTVTKEGFDLGIELADDTSSCRVAASHDFVRGWLGMEPQQMKAARATPEGTRKLAEALKALYKELGSMRGLFTLLLIGGRTAGVADIIAVDAG
ncbi:hypothetical protein HK105_207764 [Polyrhizophydium stewartii]|uniref:RecQ-mediated genome instability protein 1 n=1 Tax=Polyrhizophydium stewartii TaxID=2732419 RepID=A0ABR4MZR2_9FUNG